MRAACAAASFPCAILLLLDGIQERVWNPQVFDLSGKARVKQGNSRRVQHEGYGEDGIVSMGTAVAAECGPQSV